jgi:PAS domain S-box-containing protein
MITSAQHREFGAATRFHLAQDQVTPSGTEGAKSGLARIRTRWPALYRLRSGIGPRLLARVLVFSAAVTLLLTLLQLSLDYRRDVAAIERRMSEIESGYIQSLGEGLWNLDRRQLELQVDGILRLPAIRFVEVREVTDRPDPMVVRVGSHQEGAVRRHEFPLLHAFHGTEQQLGLLSVEATLDDVYRELFHTATVVLVSQGAAIFLVSFFILFIVRGLITRHLAAIARYVGGYDVRRPPPPLRLARPSHRRPDELDELVGAFNSMSASLQAAYGELRESEQRFRDYTETASDWLWATDREHRFTFVSEQGGAFGYDWDTPIGRHRWDLAADFTSEPEKWREHIAAVDRHEPFRDLVYELRRSDGSTGFASVSGKPVFDDEGRFSGYRGVASDLTDRKRAEQALQRSEFYLAEAQRLSRAGSWAWSIATREITHWSQESYRLFGFDAEAGTPRVEAVQKRVHPEDGVRLTEIVERAIHDGAEYELDFRVVLPEAQSSTFIR